MSRHQHEDGFAHSMTDLMAGVAVTFLLLAAIFIVQADALKRDALRKKAEAEKQASALRNEPEARRELTDLDDRLTAALAEGAQKAQVFPDPKDPLVLLVIFESDDWFPSGACVPSRDVRQRIAPILADVFSKVCDPRYQHIESIILEGHSDRNPLYPGRGGSERCGAVERYTGSPGDIEGFHNNVRLSAARAQEVFFIAREAILASSAERSAIATCIEQKFVVSGRGPVQPRDGSDWHTNQPREALSADRRVVLKVRFRQRDVDPSAGASAR